MKMVRSLTAQSPALVISMLALVMSVGGGAAYAATSSAAPSQPAAVSVSWHKLGLLHGWKSSQGNYGTGDPRYSVSSSGIVYLSGSMHQSSGTNTVFAVLPRAARPAHNLYMPIYTFGASAGSLVILKNGSMAVFSNNAGNVAQEYSSLAGISFPRTS